VKSLLCAVLVVGLAATVAPAQGVREKTVVKEKTVVRKYDYHFTRPGKVDVVRGKRVWFGVPHTRDARVERVLVKVNGRTVAEPVMQSTDEYLNYVYEPREPGVYSVELVPVYRGGRRGKVVTYHVTVRR
jgi:hypothetical protein